MSFKTHDDFRISVDSVPLWKQHFFLMKTACGWAREMTGTVVHFANELEVYASDDTASIVTDYWQALD